MDEEASTVTASEAELGSELDENDSSHGPEDARPQNDEEIPQEEGDSMWYNQRVFQRYWKHYKLAWDWYRYHCQITKPRRHPHGVPTDGKEDQVSVSGSSIATERSNTSKTSSKSSRSRPAVSTMKRRNKRRRRRRQRALEKRAQKAREEKLSSGGYNAADNQQTCDLMGDDDGEYFEMEITQEMVDFFAKSAKHKEDRDAARREQEGSGPSEYVDITEVSSGKQRSTTAPPSERPGVKRTEQMKLLYGSGAAMIHGMETAMQLNYDRNCDIKTPKHWPHLPLNIVFHS